MFATSGTFKINYEKETQVHYLHHMDLENVKGNETIPSTPSSMSSRLKTGTVGSICLLDFFLSEPFLLDLEFFFRDPPQRDENIPAFLGLGLRGGS